MLVYRSFSELREYLDAELAKGSKIGFVPTMGALHDGHLSLIKASQSKSDITVCSVFVNPTQFNNATDLEKYPRNEERDINLLREAGCDVAIFPTVDEVYPKGMDNDPIDLAGLDVMMEGADRPGHFDGVVQVVWRFFEQIQPDFAFFGEKDYQQLAVIKRMVQVKNSSIQIVGCAIKREKSGLAMSSRNVRLSQKGLKSAEFLSEMLHFAKNQVNTQNPDQLAKEIGSKIQNHPDFDLGYFEILDGETLGPINDTTTHKHAFVAATIENVRLIDNMAL